MKAANIEMTPLFFLIFVVVVANCRTLAPNGDRLKHLPEEILTEELGLPHQTINRSCAGLSGFNDGFFSRRPNLLRLYLFNNRITRLQPGLLSPLKKLLIMDVSTNDISTTANAFDGLESLRILVLCNNRIHELTNESFSSLGNLEILNLRNNEIFSVKVDAFVGLDNLTILDLSHNYVYDLPKSLFSPLKRLKELYLQRNQIQIIAGKNFDGLISLKILNLNDNRINGLTEKTFEPLKKLRDLKLSKNSISKIMTNAFADLRNLERLNMTHNNISELQEGLLLPLKKLKKLDLASNQIQIITNAFVGLEKLRSLNMSRNRISKLQQNLFWPLKNLTRLNLRHNLIGKMANANLRIVDTSKNIPSELPQYLFRNLKNLTNLDLSHNYIVSTSEAFVGLDQMTNLKISNNPLSYDIRKSYLAGTTNRTRIIMKNVGDGNRCIYGDAFGADESSSAFSRKVLSSNSDRAKELAKLSTYSKSSSNYTKPRFLACDDGQGLLVEFRLLTPTPEISSKCHEVFDRDGILEFSRANFTEQRAWGIQSEWFTYDKNVTRTGIHGIRMINWGSREVPSQFVNTLSRLISVVEMINCLMDKLKKNDFHNHNLIKLTVVGSSRIQFIENNVFNTVKLEILNLSRNNISAIEAGAFNHLPQLKLLDLSENSIKSLEPRVFFKLTNLNELALHHNRLERINDIIFDLPDLENLDVSHNNITSIEIGTFGKSRGLCTLRLDGNHVEKLVNGSLFGLRKESSCRVCVSVTNLEFIEGGVFDHFGDL